MKTAANMQLVASLVFSKQENLLNYSILRQVAGVECNQIPKLLYNEIFTFLTSTIFPE